MRLIWPLVGFAALTACGNETRVLHAVPVTVLPSEATVEVDGATLTLTSATVTLANLQLETPPESTASLWRSLSPIATAHAHPGHGATGSVAGELTGEWTVDLLGDATMLGNANLYDGAYATAALTHPEAGLARLEGNATTGALTAPFAFELTPAQTVSSIDFIANVSADTAPTGLTLQLDLAHALSFADWNTPDEDGDGVLTLDDGVLGNTVEFGLLSTPTYTLTLEN